MKRKARSIRLRYTVIFALILGAAIALSVLFNNIGLENYYVIDKTQTMVSALENIDRLIKENSTEENSSINSGDTSDNTSDDTSQDDFFQWPFDSKKKKNDSIEEIHNEANAEETDELTKYLINIQNESNITTMIISGNNTVTVRGMDSSWLMRLFVELKLGFDENDGKKKLDIISTGANYQVLKTNDSGMNTDYLVCMGNYDDGSIILMRTPLLSMAESADISNRFYIYVGLIALLVGTIIMYFVMGFITKPITSLTEISKQMSQLDFEAKYKGRSKDEIGELGQHMNEMSEILEETIAKLKTANFELQQDIDAKNNLARERSEFIANVSHELKTPIALIQGYAEGLIDGVADDPESMQFYCEVIGDEAEKMNRMVKRLLSLNQLEFGSEKLEMNRFDITQLIKAVVDSQTILARQKDAVIVFNHNDPLFVWADEYRIEEVITNFISNAIHYVSGKNIIEIRLLASGDKCRVEVYNSGSHIPDEDINKVWEKFYKVDKARTREYGGNGIGLSIVKAVVELHGGTCKAENTPDGVMFWMEIPRRNN